MTEAEGASNRVPDNAAEVFGERLALAESFAAMLREQGEPRGLIGPRELDRLWERHLLNSAVLAELLTPNCSVVDVGSGAGLPGIPLAIARPDVELTLLEPMARRVSWLQEVIDELGLAVEVIRGRAEEGPVRKQLAGQDVVTARAVAPMARLAKWCLPLLRPGGHLLALKGSSAAEELERDGSAIKGAGGGRTEVISCGDGVLDVPTTVVQVERAAGGKGKAAAARRRDGERRTRKDR
ncbi:16S rRNA (guanine(527)-N(7))-methyltransferase RsmG [Parasphingorhabdus pacifica]